MADNLRLDCHPFPWTRRAVWELTLTADGSVCVGFVGGLLTCHALAKKWAWRGKRACKVVIMCPIYLVHYNIWESSLKTMAHTEGCHSGFTFTNRHKAFVPSEWIIDRPQIIQDNRMEGCVRVRVKLNVCVCFVWVSMCVCMCVTPLVFNFPAGPFCRAPQDKLPCMVVFERQCSAQRKGQGWNTGNRPIKIHHFDPADLPLLGGCTDTHTHTLTHEHALASQNYSQGIKGNILKIFPNILGKDSHSEKQTFTSKKTCWITEM